MSSPQIRIEATAYISISTNYNDINGLSSRINSPKRVVFSCCEQFVTVGLRLPHQEFRESLLLHNQRNISIRGFVNRWKAVGIASAHVLKEGVVMMGHNDDKSPENLPHVRVCGVPAACHAKPATRSPPPPPSAHYCTKHV